MNVKSFHEILRYLFQILTTPLVWETLINYIIIDETIDKDIILALEKRIIISDKSNSNGTSEKHGNTPNNGITIFKPIVISTIKNIRKNSKYPDIDAIYCYISKSETTNAELDLIESTLNKLIRHKFVYNKPTAQRLGTNFIVKLWMW